MAKEMKINTDNEICKDCPLLGNDKEIAKNVFPCMCCIVEQACERFEARQMELFENND